MLALMGACCDCCGKNMTYSNTRLSHFFNIGFFRGADYSRIFENQVRGHYLEYRFVGNLNTGLDDFSLFRILNYNYLQLSYVFRAFTPLSSLLLNNGKKPNTPYDEVNETEGVYITSNLSGGFVVEHSNSFLDFSPFFPKFLNLLPKQGHFFFYRVKTIVGSLGFTGYNESYEYIFKANKKLKQRYIDVLDFGNIGLTPSYDDFFTYSEIERIFLEFYVNEYALHKEVNFDNPPISKELVVLSMQFNEED